MRKAPPDRLLPQLSLALLVLGCLFVVWPFLTALVWAAILASTSWPALQRLERVLGGRRLPAAGLITLLVTVVLLGPVAIVALVLADNVNELLQAASSLFQDGLPDAPDWLRRLPLLGPSLHDYWQGFAHNGPRLITELQKLARPAQDAALAGGRIVAKGAVDIALSVFLTFFFLLHGEALARRLDVALHHLGGERGGKLLDVARSTVAGVIYGILGTGLAQGLLAAFGFLVAGVPGAILLGVATFFLSVVPVGPPLVWGGAAIWLFREGQPGWALFVAAWGFFVVSTVDNLIKPFIISRGANLPFAIVFLGVLGGMFAFGVIGAFLGPALLAVGYRLAVEWTAQNAPPAD